MSQAGPAADAPHEKALRHLEKMQKSQHGMWNVAPAEGEYLSTLVKKLNARRVLEIGTSNGYSGIWFALGLRETGGKLITLEIDRGRHDLALENFQAAGVADLIDARLGDALQQIAGLEGPFDVVFIDANKGDYLRYLNLVLPKVRAGGAIAAHNVDDYPDLMRDFLEAVRSSPQLNTEWVHLGPGGFSVSFKK